MAEYIEREIAKGKFSDHLPIGRSIRDTLDEVPAADVVEVVRCKDCKHFKPNARASERFGCGRCIRNSSFEPLELTTVMECDFCSYGERRSQ